MGISKTIPKGARRRCPEMRTNAPDAEGQRGYVLRLWNSGVLAGTEAVLQAV